MQITKRNGKIKDFNRNRIVTAIENAMKETDNGIDSDLSSSIALKIEYKVHNENICKTVEEIQDMVEYHLVKSPRKDVASAYKMYRKQRMEDRMRRTELYKMGKTILEVQDLEMTRENANLNGESFSGKMSKFGSEYSKWYATSFVMDKTLVEAFENNYVYIHDLDQYALGTTNCIFIPFGKLLKKGFNTGNGFIRTPKSILTAMNLVAIIFQSQQNAQYGGVSGNKIDWDLAPYVALTFSKFFKKGLRYFDEVSTLSDNEIRMDNQELSKQFPKSYAYALEETVIETNQGAEALIHNLNTMSSRAGGQIPFTSLNYGTCVSPEGRLIIQSLLNATMNGLGNGETPIFPIQIFKCKQGVNLNPGDPNYDLFIKSIECSSKRLYPNFANLDAPMNLQYYKENDPDSEFATMGCRTRVIADRFGYNHLSGKGNLSFNTINLVKLGIEHGICQEERTSPDLEGFYQKLNQMLSIALDGLMHRYRIQANQQVKASDFMMREGVWENGETLQPHDTVGDLLKHGSVALGFIGLAECMKALFGKHHAEDETVYEEAKKLIAHMRQFCDEASDDLNMNVTLFATPAEGLSGKFTKYDKKEFGCIPGVTDREYYTNSFHVPVYYHATVSEKVNIEAPFHELCNAGAISYVELDGSAKHNLDAFETIVRYALDQNISYFSVNHQVDRCGDCGCEGIINESCPQCGNEDNISRLRRVTGYLTGDYKTRFNPAKQAEVEERVKHQ